MFDVTEVRRIVRRELDEMRRLVAELPVARWHAATRCDGWDVADVCSHAGVAAVQQAEAFRRAAKGVLEPPEYPGTVDLSPEQIVDLLADGASQLDAALADLPDGALGAMTPLPFGVVPTIVALQIPVYEFAFHTDDVRHAVGGDGSLADDVAAGLVAFFAGLAPMLASRAAPGAPDVGYRLQSSAAVVTLAPAIDGWTAVEDTDQPLCTIAGADVPVSLFAMGRCDAADPRLTISGRVDAAAEFKRWFPGP